MAPLTTLLVGGVAPRAAGYGYDICRRALTQLRARGSRIVLTDRQSALDLVPELTALADETHALDFTDTEACAAWARERVGQFDAVIASTPCRVSRNARTCSGWRAIRRRPCVGCAPRTRVGNTCAATVFASRGPWCAPSPTRPGTCSPSSAGSW